MAFDEGRVTYHEAWSYTHCPTNGYGRAPRQESLTPLTATRRV